MTSEAIATDSGDDFDIDSSVDELGSSLFGDDDVADEENLESESEGESEDTSEKSPEETSEEETSVEENAQEKAPEIVSDTPDLPASWKKEMAEQWGTLTPEVKSYIIQREQQMKDGLAKDRHDSNLGRAIRDVIEPYGPMLQQMQTDEPTMIKNLMSSHYRLSTSPPAERAALFQQLARHYGVNLNSSGEQPEVDPVIYQLQHELNTIKSSINAKEAQAQQAARQSIQSEVEAFASENPLFDEVADEILAFINKGDELKDAYEKAIWANPVTRAKELQRQNEEALKTQREEAKKKATEAKKAKSANIRKRDTQRAPTGPIGSFDDTLNETYDAILKRS